jgi:restriction system protein
MEGKLSLDRIGEILQAVFRQLQKAGGEAKLREIIPLVEPQLNLSPYEKEVYPKTGYVRWISHVHFYSVDCVKAGYITKSAGKWRLTKQGEEALKLPPGQFVRSAQKKYREWKAARSSGGGTETKDTEIEESDKIVRQTAYEQAVEQAQSEIENHIDLLGPYDFQRLVAELLIGMGYHVPTIAPPGPDGGIDIVAYKDPLGTSTPRIRVQVKHRDQKVNVKDVREMEGLLRKDGDMGLIVSSGGFTSDALQEIRSSSKHIETMDLDRLIQLWSQHYDNIRESGKLLLPLVKLHFLAPTEEQ